MEKRDVFISWTGEAKELKDKVKYYLGEYDLSFYDSETDCYGEFRPNYLDALKKCDVYLVLLTDGLLNEGHFTEVQNEIEHAVDLERRGLINIEIFIASKRFYFNELPTNPVQEFIYNNLGLYKKSSVRVGYCDGDYNAIEEKDFRKAAADCRRYVDARLEGKPVVSFNPLMPLQKNNIFVEEQFKGREKDLQKIDDAFNLGKKVVILSGMGGIGKTELAKKYAVEHSDKFFCPQIITISDSATNQKGLRNIVFSADFTEEADLSTRSLNPDEHYKNRLKKLKTLNERFLLIVDNYNILEESKLREIIEELNCRLLITTRNARFGSENAAVITVKELEQPTAAGLFMAHYCADREYTDEEKAKIDKIIDEIKGHTMLIKLVAIQMREHDIGFDEEIENLKNITKIAQSVDNIHNDFEGNVTIREHLKALFGTYGIRNSNRQETANFLDCDDVRSEILRNLSLCYYDGIEKNLFIQAMGLESDNELLQLFKFGVVQIESGDDGRVMLSLHPLVSSVCANELKPTYEKCKNLVDAITESLSKDTADFSVAEKYFDFAEFMLKRLLDNGSYCRALNEVYIKLSKRMGNSERTLEAMREISERINDIGADNSAATELDAERICFSIQTRGEYDSERIYAEVDKISEVSPIKAAKCALNVLAFIHDEKTIEWAARHILKADDEMAFIMFASVLYAVGGNKKEYKYIEEFIKKHKKDLKDDDYFYCLQFILATIKMLGKESLLSLIDDQEKIKKQGIKHPILMLKMISLGSKLVKSGSKLGEWIENAGELTIKLDGIKDFFEEFLGRMYNSGLYDEISDIFSMFEAVNGVLNFFSKANMFEIEGAKINGEDLFSSDYNFRETIMHIDNAYQTYKIAGKREEARVFLELKLQLMRNNLPSMHIEIAKTELLLVENILSAEDLSGDEIREAVEYYSEAIGIYEKIVPESSRYYETLSGYCSFLIRTNDVGFWEDGKTNGDVAYYGLRGTLSRVLEYYKKTGSFENIRWAYHQMLTAYEKFCSEESEAIWKSYLEWIYPACKAKRRKKVRNKKLPNGAVYTGQMLGDILDGVGVFQTEKQLYTGSFIADYRHGYGQMILSNGDSYYGQWYKGMLCGKGTYKWANGEIYEGEFKDDKANGRGKKIWANGNSYEGDWENGRTNGKGTFKWANGDIYEGEFREGRINGHGKKIWANGDIYEGEFREGRINGHGKKTFANGDSYEGEYKLGKKDGHGKQIWASGNSYEGEYKDDKITGFGTYRWKNGISFEGEWDGKKFGPSVLISANGRKYSGDWEEDYFVVAYQNGIKIKTMLGEMAVPTGKGIYVTAEGREYAGQWLENRDNDCDSSALIVLFVGGKGLLIGFKDGETKPAPSELVEEMSNNPSAIINTEEDV